MQFARLLAAAAEFVLDALHPGQTFFDVEGYEPVGCKHCGGSGYRGRTGIYEVMKISPEMRALALERRSSDEILEMAVVQGMHRLKDDGLDKVKQGRTSMAEIARVVNAGSDRD